MLKIKVIGIDLAKRVMQIRVMDEIGKVRRNAKLSPAKVSELLANTPQALVAMECCSMAHYWGRLAGSFRHEVRLIPPQHVKAFRRVHKSWRGRIQPPINDTECMSVNRSSSKRQCGYRKPNQTTKAFSRKEKPRREGTRTLPA